MTNKILSIKTSELIRDRFTILSILSKKSGSELLDEMINLYGSINNCDVTFNKEEVTVNLISDDRTVIDIAKLPMNIIKGKRIQNNRSSSYRKKDELTERNKLRIEKLKSSGCNWSSISNNLNLSKRSKHFRNNVLDYFNNC